MEQQKNDMQKTYTANQIAEILNVSIRTAYNLCDTTKHFKIMRLGKRCLRIHKESFDNWFNDEFGIYP
jgi:hypothetical protein